MRLRSAHVPQFQVTSAPTIPTDVEHPSLTPWKACAIGLGVVGLLVALAVLDTRAREEEDGAHLFGARRGRRRKRGGVDLGDVGAVRVPRKGMVKARSGEWVESHTTENIPEDEREAWYMHERDVPTDRREAFEKGFTVGRDTAEAIPEVRKRVLDLIDENVNSAEFDRESAKIRDIIEHDEGAIAELYKGSGCIEQTRTQLVEEPDKEFIDEIFDRRGSKLTRGRDWNRAFEAYEEYVEEGARRSYYENLDENDCHYFVEEAKKDCESECESEKTAAADEAASTAVADFIERPDEENLDKIFNGEGSEDWQERLDEYAEEHGGGAALTEDQKFDRGYKAGKRELAKSIKTFESKLKQKDRAINEQADTVRALRAQLKAAPLISPDAAVHLIARAVEEGRSALNEGNCTQTQNSLIEAQAAVMWLELKDERAREHRQQIASVQGLRADMHRVCALTARFVPNAPPSPVYDPEGGRRLPEEIEEETERGREALRRERERERTEPVTRFRKIEVDGLGGVRVRGHVRSRPRRCRGVCR